MFPVPASAAICAFQMETSDGRVVTGVAKEKEAAQQEFEQATHGGHFAGLINYVTDDRSIPAYANVKVRLEYVMNLANDDNTDEIRFQLSSGVGQRYGSPPEELTSAFRPTSSTKVRITCEIQTAGRIKGISSPSHGNDIKETRYSTENRPSRRRTTIRYRSPSFLDRDFILIIGAYGLDSPRCFAEMREDDQGQRTIALQLTVVPKLHLPAIAAQEYLFVVDRSGSMGTEIPRSRMEVAKDTLLLLLRLLPPSGTSFNIQVFDNVVESFNHCSVPYNEKTLKDASAYVDGVEARNGTELTKAIRQVLAGRNRSIPTAVFVLTDGEVFDNNNSAAVVAEEVKQASSTAPLRVFTLGIGNQVSTATCESIAIAGNGVYLYATQAENILGKCARLFRAGRTPIVQNASVDWCIPNEYLWTQGVTFSGHTLSPRSIAHSPPSVQQAPAQVDNIHSGTQTVVSTIIQLKKYYAPVAVYLRGELDNNGSPFEIRIPVEKVRLNGVKEGLPLIHIRTAWRLIQEHEAKRGKLPSSIIPATEEEVRKAIIVNLGKRYQLVSEHTSFVAIDSGQNDRSRIRRQRSNIIGSPSEPTPEVSDRSPRQSHSFLGLIANLFSGLLWQDMNTRPDVGTQLPGSWPTPSESSADENNGGHESDGSADSRETFSTLSSLNSCDCSDFDSVPPSPDLRPRLSPEEEDIQRQPSPRFGPRTLDPNGAPPRMIRVTQPIDIVSPAIIELVRLQSFDGSYTLETLRNINIAGMGRAVNEVNNFAVDRTVWATALAIALMKREMGQTSLLNDLVAKALEFLEGKTNIDVDDLLKLAKDALGDVM
ncbi:hypothetical protein H0H93_013062 [Arthromyces matolae]|nr:hypothetical protein H0H93_013062 [Arthromyces matolae]